MKEILCVAVCAMLFALWSVAEAQQAKKVPRIGYLSGSDPKGAARGVEAFRQGLQDLGYIEGRNILIEYRHAEGKRDRFPSLATELVQLKVDVLFVSVLTAVRAAKQATKTIPIVMVLPWIRSRLG
jgi:ABC-type uncharacterized transport system substrate-binding protein